MTPWNAAGGVNLARAAARDPLWRRSCLAGASQDSERAYGFMRTTPGRWIGRRRRRPTSWGPERRPGVSRLRSRNTRPSIGGTHRGGLRTHHLSTYVGGPTKVNNGRTHLHGGKPIRAKGLHHAARTNEAEQRNSFVIYPRRRRREFLAPSSHFPLSV